MAENASDPLRTTPGYYTAEGEYRPSRLRARGLSREFSRQALPSGLYMSPFPTRRQDEQSPEQTLRLAPARGHITSAAILLLHAALLHNHQRYGAIRPPPNEFRHLHGTHRNRSLHCSTTDSSALSASLRNEACKSKQAGCFRDSSLTP